MILQIMYDKGKSSRQDEQYIGEVEEVRFYDTSLTYKKNNSESDKGFIHEIDYVAEDDIDSIYLLNNDGKTVKVVRGIQSILIKKRENCSKNG